MKETILLFNIQDRQKALKIEMALFPLHVRLRRIKPEDYGHTLGYLAGLKDAEPAVSENAFQELDSEMIVFAFFEDKRLNQALAALRRSGAGPLPYKAILTPTNQDWTPTKCFEEIRQEHETMNSDTRK